MTTAHPDRLSSGVVVVHGAKGGMQILLLRAYKNWDFPKGMVEPGETPLDAALREVCEETTLEKLDFDWGTDFVETGPYNNGKYARYYLARSKQTGIELPINPELGRPEHHEARWVTFEQAAAMVAPRLVPVLRWARDTVNE